MVQLEQTPYEEDPKVTKQEHRLMVRSGMVIGVVGALAVGALGGGLGVYYYDRSHREQVHVAIDATVQCSDSLPVTGVWLTTAGGRSGWATHRSLNAKGDMAAIGFTDGDGTDYRLDVGCGGTPQHWAHNLHSMFIDRQLTSPTIVCSTDVNPNQGPQCVVLQPR